MGLHDIYMDDPAEKPSYAGVTTYGSFPTITAPDLGPYDIGNNLTYNGEPDALLSLWGAVASPALITPDDNQPVFLVHGTADVIVPFDIGSPFQVPAFPLTYGSNQINIKLNALGLTDKMTYFVQGQGHEFYGVTNGMWNNGTGGNAYWDTIVKKTATFFYTVHKPVAAYSFTYDNLTVNFTDLTTGSTAWYWTFDDGTTSTVQNPIHNFLSNGTYQVKLYVQNNIDSWDTVTHTVFLTAIPANLTVSDTMVHNNESHCYNATQVITVSDFTVEAGGNANLVAGEAIHFLPDILVQPEGTMHAYITITDDYCPSRSPSVAAVVLGDNEFPQHVDGSWFIISPNPTPGNFTLEFRDAGIPSEVQVTVYGMHGEKILETAMHQEKRRTFCLESVPSGIYIIRILKGNESVTRKLVKI
jgi:hypothetical protein